MSSRGSAYRRLKKPIAKAAVGLVLSAAIVLSGIAIGTGIGRYWLSKKRLATRAEMTNAIVRRMGTVSVGQVLPNCLLEDRNQGSVWLWQLLSHRTLVSFFHSECDGCAVELENLKAACRDTADYQYFILISSEHPASLTQLRHRMGGSCRVYHDRGESYARELKVYDYPFNIAVDSNGIIESIIAGAMEPKELAHVIKANRDTRARAETGYERRAP